MAGVEVAHQQGDGRALRLEVEFDGAQEIGPHYAGRRGDQSLQCRVERCVPPGRDPGVDIGRQHRIEPFGHRGPKAAHHDRHRRAQGEACHHTGEARGDRARRLGDAGGGQPGGGPAPQCASGQSCQQPAKRAGEQRHAGDARHQPQCNRDISADRQSCDWWQGDQQRTGCGKRQRPAPAGQAGQRVFGAAAAQCAGRGGARGGPGRHCRSQHADRKAKQGESAERQRLKHHARSRSAEIAAAQVAADCRQQQGGQPDTGGGAQQRAQCA